MRRLAWSQLRFRRARALALLAGMLVAVTAFTVLTAAARTSQLRTIGTVTAHFRTAYDILVRPPGSRTALESRTGTVQPNFLSGIYGGITMAQYREIQQIPGVQVAAPIAMVGYMMPEVPVTVELPAAAATGHGRQLYRITTTWVSEAGSVRIPQPPSYAYVTSNAMTPTSIPTFELLPDGSKVPVCYGYPISADYPPFGAGTQSSLWCWSRANGMFGEGDFEGLTARRPGFAVEWWFPMLVAAIDPVAEAKLDDLNRAVISGRYLSRARRRGVRGRPRRRVHVPGAGRQQQRRGRVRDGPGAAAAQPGQPAGARSPRGCRPSGAVPGRTVDEFKMTAGQAYLQMLALLAGTKYQDFEAPPSGTGTWARPPTVGAAAAAWWPSRYATPHRSGRSPYPAPAACRWTRRRPLTGPSASTRRTTPPCGPFRYRLPWGSSTRARSGRSIRCLRCRSGPYQPTAAAAADAASRRALGGRDLLPSLNLGGYISQPVQLITTLSALPFIENSAVFTGDLHAADPISVIRVRVAGVTGPNPLSLARIKEVAQLIAVRTHLAVDIVTGSSPTPVTVSLPDGTFGQPPLLLTEDWVKKGVAVAILSAVDKNSVVLFTLILVVCALFVANSATAAVRSRRQELGVLACLGWTRPRIYATVLGELALLGLAAGVAGGALSLPLSAALGLRVSPGRAILAVPAAVGLAVAAGGVPAWLASRADPVAAVRPPVLNAGQARHLRGVTGLAVVNVLRTPGRSLVGAFSLAVGVAALTLLTAVTLAFRGAVVGSLLGNAVAVQVRGVDYVAVTATVVLGVLAVADVLFLNIRERAAELAAIRALGWPESALGRLVVTEGAVIGLAGSLAGAAAGLAAAAEFAGQFPARLLLAATAAVLAGVLVTVAAALLPAQLLRRLPTAQLLAEE